MNPVRTLSLALFVPLLGVLPCLAGVTGPTNQAPKPKLAVLIASANPGETATKDDIADLAGVLQRRGYRPEEIVMLSGPIRRTETLPFLREVARRVASWTDGEVFLAYSGSGAYKKTPSGDPRPAMDLPGEMLLWDEVFEILALPRGVHLTLLADCCHNNLLAGRVPANVTALVQQSLPGHELFCHAQNGVFRIDGVRVLRGILTYYAARALEQATTTENWLRITVALCDADVARGTLPPQFRLSLTLAGMADVPLAGAAVK